MKSGRGSSGRNAATVALAEKPVLAAKAALGGKADRAPRADAALSGRDSIAENGGPLAAHGQSGPADRAKSARALKDSVKTASADRASNAAGHPASERAASVPPRSVAANAANVPASTAAAASASVRPVSARRLAARSVLAANFGHGRKAHPAENGPHVRLAQAAKDAAGTGRRAVPAVIAKPAPSAKTVRGAKVRLVPKGSVNAARAMGEDRRTAALVSVAAAPVAASAKAGHPAATGARGSPSIRTAHQHGGPGTNLGRCFPGG